MTLVTSAAASFATVGLLALGFVWYVLVSILGVPANVKFLVLPFVLVGSFVLFFAALVGDSKVCGAFLRSSSGRAAAFVRVCHKGLVISSVFALEGMRALVSRFSVIEGLNRHVLAGSLFSGTGEQASGRVDVPWQGHTAASRSCKRFYLFLRKVTWFGVSCRQDGTMGHCRTGQASTLHSILGSVKKLSTWSGKAGCFGMMTRWNVLGSFGTRNCT